MKALRRKSQSASKQAPPKQAMPLVVHVSSPLFHGMQENDIRAMLDVADFADSAPRTWLYRQGEPARQFFLLEAGLVRLNQLTSEGDNVLVRFVKPGEVFGYVTLAMGERNMESAQVIQPSRLVVWERNIALHLLQSMPTAVLNLFNLAVHDVLYFIDHICRLQTQDVARRLAWALSELVRIVGVSTPAGMAITIGLRELADLAGTTIFTASRELTKLQCKGILKKQRGRIVILGPEKRSD